MNQTQIGQDVIFSLKQALVYEEVKGAFELASLDNGFYKSVRAKMEGLNGEELGDAEKFMRKLVSKRTSKIVRSASLIPLAQVIEIKLTSEEKELYDSINKSCNVFNNTVTKGEKQNV